MKRGMTLVEILVVMGVIALIAGLSVPAIVAAKKRGKDATTISNLHQCGMALLIYADENGGVSELPTGDGARLALKGGPTCDPQDTWRTSCEQPSISPMIGSYAYVRYVKEFEKPDLWSIYQKWNSNPALLVSIFSASNPPKPFNQPDTSSTEFVGEMPDRITKLFMDGSTRSFAWSGNRRDGFRWWVLFAEYGDRK